MKRWHFVEDEGKLISGSDVVGVTPKAAAVLGHLIAHKGEIVSREQLIAAVWPGLHVTPDLVREYIFDLRNAVGDDAKSPQYIQTVRGKGFRLIGDIVATQRPEIGPAQTVDRGEIRPMIAVLRPDCHQNDPHWQSFMDGVAEDLTIMLTRAREIAVVSRHSSFAADKGRDLRDVAADLGAGYLLVSSIAVFGDTARTAFQLVDGHTGGYVWSQRYEHPVGALLPLADTIVGIVSTELVGWHGELYRAEFRQVAAKAEDSLNGYQHYIRARDLTLHRDQAGLRKALSHLEECLTREPGFVNAWVFKCVVCHWLSTMSGHHDKQLLETSDKAIEQAFHLDPDHIDILYILALKTARKGDYGTAIRLTRRAVAQPSPDARGYLCISALHTLIDWEPEAAAAALEQALSRITLPEGWHRMFEGRLAFFLGDYERAVPALAAGTEHVASSVFSCLSYAMLDDMTSARESLAAIRAQQAEFDFRAYAQGLPIAHPEALARYYTAVARITDLDKATSNAVLAECSRWAAQ